MEWVTKAGNIQHLMSKGINLTVQPVGTRWVYTVEILNADDFEVLGSADTEDSAKASAISEAHSVVQGLVYDLAEITGEDYHLELN